MFTVDGDCDRLVRWWINSKVFQALVVAMRMIVVDVFFNGPAKRAFPKEDHLAQAFGFDAAEKAFDKRIGGMEERRNGGMEEWRSNWNSRIQEMQLLGRILESARQRGATAGVTLRLAW